MTRSQAVPWRPAAPMGRSLALVVVAAAVLGIAADTGPLPQPDTQAEALARLRSMPQAARLELWERLQAFERLPSTEREAIRKLDTSLAELAPEIRARYLRVIDRYQVWLAQIPAEERARIEAADAESRIVAVREALARYPLSAPSRIDDLMARTGGLNAARAFDQAHWIRIWLALDPGEREEVTRAPTADRINRLEAIGRRKQVPDERPELLRRLEQEVTGRFREAARRPGMGKMMQNLKAQASRELLERGVEARYLSSITPQPVAPANLERFQRAIPDWLRAALLPLPPPAARERLTLLYRLVFPHPQEYVPTEADAAAAAEARPGGPAVEAKPAADTNPF